MVERVVVSPRQAIKILLRITRRLDLIVSLGKFTLPGWPSHATWYLFECGSCGTIQKNYPQRYTDHGFVKLPCEGCGAYYALAQRRFYENDDLAMPPILMTKQERKEAWLQEVERRKNFGKTPLEP